HDVAAEGMKLSRSRSTTEANAATLAVGDDRSLRGANVNAAAGAGDVNRVAREMQRHLAAGGGELGGPIGLNHLDGSGCACEHALGPRHLNISYATQGLEISVEGAGPNVASPGDGDQRNPKLIGDDVADRGACHDIANSTRDFQRKSGDDGGHAVERGSAGDQGDHAQVLADLHWPGSEESRGGRACRGAQTQLVAEGRTGGTAQ